DVALLELIHRGVEAQLAPAPALGQSGIGLGVEAIETATVAALAAAEPLVPLAFLAHADRLAAQWIDALAACGRRQHQRRRRDHHVRPSNHRASLSPLAAAQASCRIQPRRTAAWLTGVESKRRAKPECSRGFSVA